MKWIKLFEDFDTVESVLQNTEDILLSLKDFGFDVKVNSESKSILVNISKSKNEEFKVFYSIDIYNLLDDCNNYLALGEGYKLETIHLETIEGDKQVEDLNQLKRMGLGILSVFISYKK